MKHILTLFLLLFPLTTFAQTTQGAIYYSETVQLNIQVPPEMQREAANFPKSMTNDKVLYFNADKSLYKDNADAKKAQQNPGEIRMGSEESGAMMVVRSGSNNSAYFKNLANGKYIQKMNFMGRDFLIADSLKTYTWALSEETKTIAGYLCVKAVHSDTTTQIQTKMSNENGQIKVENVRMKRPDVIAWFAPDLAVSSGPEGYQGLPGMILQLDMDMRSIVATKVDSTPLATDAIKEPTGGQKVTLEEFERIRKQKMKEMEEEMGGSRRNGNMQTIIIGRGE